MAVIGFKLWGILEPRGIKNCEYLDRHNISFTALKFLRLSKIVSHYNVTLKTLRKLSDVLFIKITDREQLYILTHYSLNFISFVSLITYFDYY